jgi:tRNA-specific 2-thiouridylase
VLSRGSYAEKDQSYALWAVSQEALSRTIFPLGEKKKPEVRELARRIGLRNAEKQESFEICFVPDDRYDRFLVERVAGLGERLAGGQVVMNGEVVGTHKGYPFYTIGQRKGLGAFGRKVYVTGIDSETNTVHIGSDDDLRHRNLVASRVNWSGIAAPKGPIRVTAKVRYKDDATAATAEMTAEGRLRVTFDEPKRAITPGQSVVLYDGSDLLGGGVIEGFAA